MVLKSAFLLATLLCASAAAARPQIYTYVDADGLRHFTDVPDNNRYRLLVLSPRDRTASGDRYDAMLLIAGLGLIAAGLATALAPQHRSRGEE